MTAVFTLPTLNAESFESGEAADGDVLTADGAGRAAWAPAGGGNAFPILPNLGEGNGWTFASISAAYEAVTGASPAWGSMGALKDMDNGAHYIVIFIVTDWKKYAPDGGW